MLWARALGTCQPDSIVITTAFIQQLADTMSLRKLRTAAAAGLFLFKAQNSTDKALGLGVEGVKRTSQSEKALGRLVRPSTWTRGDASNFVCACVSNASSTHGIQHLQQLSFACSGKGKRSSD